MRSVGLSQLLVLMMNYHRILIRNMSYLRSRSSIDPKDAFYNLRVYDIAFRKGSIFYATYICTNYVAWIDWLTAGTAVWMMFMYSWRIFLAINLILYF